MPRTARERRFDLVAFDVDGTLVEHPEGKTVWEVLNRRFTGNEGTNQERLEAYRAGLLTYADWVSLDVEGWRRAGATRAEIASSFAPLRLVRGARETLDRLKQAGLGLVVISGTLDLLLETLLPGAPFDEIHCNRLHFDPDGKIASWTATPFDMAGKTECLRAIAARRGIPLSRTAFVGDSANDVWIAREAGLTIAFNPKSEEFERLAHVVVRSDDLRAILPHLIGP
jgi:phosphoserine phosphatase